MFCKDWCARYKERKSLILVVLIGMVANSIVASVPDSIQIQIQNIPSDTAKVTYINLVSRDYFRKDPKIAQELLEEAIKLSRISNSPYHEAVTLKNLGTSYFYVGENQKASESWKSSLAKFQKIQDAKGIADLNNNLAVIFQRMGNVDSSLFYNLKSLELRKKSGDTLNIANSNANIGSLYRSKGDYEKAMEFYHAALSIYEKLDKQKQISDAYNSIGLVYMNLKDYEQSLKYIQQSLEIRKEINDVRGIASSTNNLAGCYEFLKQYDQAKKYYLDYLEQAEKLGDRRGVAGALSNLGNIYRNAEDFDKGLENYIKAKQEFRALNDPEGLAIAYNNIGLLYSNQGKFQQAIESFDSAFTIAQSTEQLELQQIAVDNLSMDYGALGDYKKAFKYRRLYSEINDSIFNIKTADAVAEYEEKYEAEKKAREIDRLTIEQQKAEKQIILRNWAIGASVLVVVLLLLLFNRAQLRRKILEQKSLMLESEKEELRLITELQQKEVDAKNRELSTYATVSLQKNETLYEVREKLDNLEGANESDLKELKSIIKSNVNLDNQWEKFKLHFESVHPEFFNKLSKKFPQLSDNDLKNCAYIRMKLSTKEVASLLNVETKSAKMIRYRLKKKMDLSAEDDLHKFIQTF